MEDEMRPLMAHYLDRAADTPTVGVYDEHLAMTLDPGGRPVVEVRRSETQTFVEKEAADDERIARFETATKVVNEPTDDDRIWAFETETRVVNEPTDDDRIWAESLRTGLPPADDCASGLVQF